MVNSVFLIFVCMFFPLAVYYLYLLYSKCSFEKENHLFLDLALYSGFYLVIRYCEIPIQFIFVVNVLILISYHYKRFFTGILLSIALIIILKYRFNIEFIYSFFNYFSILSFLLLKKRILNSFLIVNFVFNMLLFLLGKFNILNFLFITVFSFTLYIFVILVINKLEITINMYFSLKEISREKKLYESLFKITHEIKNPLAVCKGYLDMFDINNKEKAKKYINVINEEINRTLLLLKDFSDISKISVEKSLIDINLLLDDVCEEVSIAFNSNIEFTWVLPEDELIIEGDYNRLKQVFINIIKNAKESIIGKGKVVLTTKMSKNNYVVTIDDNGIGLDNETLKNIGQPFYTTKKDGTGLGVCLSREIIERHSGLIKYKSKKYKGTKVDIILPIKNI